MVSLVAGQLATTQHVAGSIPAWRNNSSYGPQIIVVPALGGAQGHKKKTLYLMRIIRALRYGVPKYLSVPK